MKTHNYFAAFAFALLQVFGTAQAQTTVTFSDVASTSYISSPVISQQVTFTPDFQHVVTASDVDPFSGKTLTGDGNFLAYNSTSGVGESFAFVASAPFNLLSLDLGGGYNFGSAARTISVTGMRTHGSSVTTLLSVASGSFTHFVLSGFSNLTSVKLGHVGDSSYYVGIDNIITTPVPEPETYAMLLVGLLMLSGMVRIVRMDYRTNGSVARQ